MPYILDLVFLIIFLQILLIVWKYLLRIRTKKTDTPANTVILIGVPIFLGVLIYNPYVKPKLNLYFSSPIVAVLPDDSLATGLWWVDKKGVGHSKITSTLLTCTQKYDAKQPDSFVFTTASCEDAAGAEIWVERFGGKLKNRGEGVYHFDGNYGWYVFGWKARLAMLSNGWVGLPWAKATREDFELIIKRAASAGVTQS